MPADCRSHLSKSLFILGEFGGNDYNAAIFGGKSLDEVYTYVPHFINKITSGVEVRTHLVCILKRLEQLHE